MTSRRALLLQMTSALGALALHRASALVPAAAAVDSPDIFTALEHASGGRLGVAFLDTATGRQGGNRQHERFPMCSTFKFLLAGAVLRRVDQGKEQLDRPVPIRREDILSYAPLTTAKVGDHLSIGELCAAAVTMSDNTAANLLLSSIGGPAALTAFLRHIGDPSTRLDRNEPTLNEAVPGDPRDTTTPAAVIDDMRKLVLGDALSPPSREKLTGWLVGCKTGDKRLRAGVPASWRVGDKTGTGSRGTANDVAIIWPTNRQPLIIAAYLTGATATDARREEVLAEVARLVTAGNES